MPTDRDYAIATMLGENRGDTNQGLAGVLDVIMNRRANPSDYQATGPSIREIVTANNGRQFNNWTPTDPNYGISNRALNGPGSLSPSEAASYYQAAQVYDDYIAGRNGYQGISQGATYYQTPASARNPNSFQNRYYGDNDDNFINISRHQFTGPDGAFISDPSAYRSAHPEQFTSQQAPAPQTDGFGVNVDHSGYPANPSNAPQGTIGRPDFGTGLTPNTYIPRFGFGNPGTSTGTIGGTDFGAGLAPPAPPPGAYDFGTGPKGDPVAPGSFGTGISTTPPQQTGSTVTNLGMGTTPTLGPTTTAQTFGSGLMGRPLGFTGTTVSPQGPGATQLPAGFDPAAYLAANPDVAAAGVPAAQHYMQYGMQEGRPLAPSGLSPTLNTATPVGTQGPGPAVPSWEPGATSPNLNTPTSVPTLGFNGFGGSTLGPGLMGRTYGFNGQTVPTLQTGTTVPTQGPGATQLPVGFDPSAYLAANPDVARAGADPVQHYLTYGMQEGRALSPSGFTPALGPGQTVPTQGPSPTTPMISPSFTGTLGPGTTVQTQGPGTTVGTNGFHGFDAQSYLAANPDVAAAHVDPLQHFLTNGFREGRALDTQGDHLNQNFDAAAYLASNPDVARAGMNPLQHYLTNGASEGRSYDIGSSPYAWTGSNVGGGMGAQPTSMSGLTPLASAPQPTAPVGPYDFTNFNPGSGLGAQPQSFGLTPLGFGSNAGGGLSNPYGFSGMNVGGGLGAMPQSFASLYPLTGGSSPVANTGGFGGNAGGGLSSPYGFSGMDVSGFDANSLPGTEGGGGGGSGDGAPRTNQASEQAYLNHQMNMNRIADMAGRPAVVNNPNLWAPTIQASVPQAPQIQVPQLSTYSPMIVPAMTPLSTSFMPLSTFGPMGI